MSIRIKLVAFAATLLLLTGSQSQAAFMGTLTFADTGSPTANTGNINTATSFTLGNVASISGTGEFAGFPLLTSFGSQTITTSGTGGLVLNNASFGNFTSQSVTLVTGAPGAISYNYVGLYNSGTFAPGATNVAASFTISFTQTPASTGAISDSASFSIPPFTVVGVPEPASFAMVAIGLGGIFAVRRFRRRAA